MPIFDFIISITRSVSTGSSLKLKMDVDEVLHKFETVRKSTQSDSYSYIPCLLKPHIINLVCCIDPSDLIGFSLNLNMWRTWIFWNYASRLMNVVEIG